MVIKTHNDLFACVRHISAVYQEGYQKALSVWERHCISVRNSMYALSVQQSKIGGSTKIAFLVHSIDCKWKSCTTIVLAFKGCHGLIEEGGCAAAQSRLE